MAGTGEQDVEGPKRNKALEAESMDPEVLPNMAKRIKLCPLSTPERPKKGTLEGTPEGTPERPKKGMFPPSPERKTIEDAAPESEIENGRLIGHLKDANNKYLAPLCSPKGYQQQLDMLHSVAEESDDNVDPLPPKAMEKDMEVIKNKPSEQQNEFEGTTTDGMEHDSASSGSPERGHRRKRTVITEERNEASSRTTTKITTVVMESGSA